MIDTVGQGQGRRHLLRLQNMSIRTNRLQIWTTGKYTTYSKTSSISAKTNQWSASSALCSRLTQLLMGKNSLAFYFYLLQILKSHSLHWMWRKYDNLFCFSNCFKIKCKPLMRIAVNKHKGVITHPLYSSVKIQICHLSKMTSRVNEELYTTEESLTV